MNSHVQGLSWRAGRTLVSALFGAALCASSVVHAAPSYSGTATGIFTTPILSGNLVNTDGSLIPLDNSAPGSADISGTNTGTFSWGNLNVDGVPPDPGPVPDHSTLQFEGVVFTNKAPDEVFKLGTLRFTNGTSFSNTLAFGITLTIGVVVDVNANVTIDPAAAQLSIITTANGTVDPLADADFVSFDVLPMTFHVFEGATATADVFGYIHGDLFVVLAGISLPPGQPGFVVVPEPSILAVLAIGLAGLGYSRRRGKLGRTPFPLVTQRPKSIATAA